MNESPAAGLIFEPDHLDPHAIRHRREMLFWLGFFVGVGLVWRVTRFLLPFPIWGDEAFVTSGVMDRGYREHFAQPPAYFQVVPLLYLWVLRFSYEVLGTSEQAFRAFSLLAGCAALLIFARVAWRTLPPQAASIAVGIFAVGYSLVRHANEAKPYGGDALVSVLMLWLAVRWIEQPRSWSRAMTLSIAACVSIWLSFPAVLIAGAMGLALAACLPWRSYPALLIYGGSISASFVAYYVSFARMQSSRSSGSWLEDYWDRGFPNLADPLNTAFWFVHAHTSDMMGYPIGGTEFRSAATGIACAIGIVALFRSGRGRLAIVLLAPFVMGMIAAMLRRYPYGVHARLAQHLAPMICLIAAVGVAAVIGRLRSERSRAIAGGGVGLILLGVAIGGIARDVIKPYKSYEDVIIREVVADLRASLPSAARIAVLNPMEFGELPDHAPQFSATARHYLHAAGFELAWCHEMPIPADVRVVVSCRTPTQPPSREQVEARLREAGFSVTDFAEHVYRSSDSRRLDVYTVEPFALRTRRASE